METAVRFNNDYEYNERQSYELTLNADSTYMFSYNITHKEAIAHKISCHGTWNISHDDIILNSSQTLQ